MRAALGVSTGDRVEFVQVEQGRIELLVATLPVSALKGIVKKPIKPVTLAEMNDAIASNEAKAKWSAWIPMYWSVNITQDEPIQSERANALFESFSTGSEANVTVVSLIELVWILGKTFKSSQDFSQSGHRVFHWCL